LNLLLGPNAHTPSDPQLRLGYTHDLRLTTDKPRILDAERMQQPARHLASGISTIEDVFEVPAIP
jgi:hypothetical protein